MVPSLTEIILLIVIVLCIFGLGKIGDISERIGEMRAKRQRGLPADDAVDITPKRQRSETTAGAEPKPGTREQPVDEAQIEPSDESKPDNPSEA